MHTFVLLGLVALVHGCTETVGDGTGGTETYLTLRDSFQECVDYVKTHQPTANGATWGPTNNRCYAEFGVTGTNGNTGWHTCIFTADEQPANTGQIMCVCQNPQTTTSTCGETCSTANTQGLGSFVPAVPFNPTNEFEDDWVASATPAQIVGMDGKWVCQSATMTGPVPEDIHCDEDDRYLMVTWNWGTGTVDLPVKRTTINVYDGSTLKATKLMGQQIISVEADINQNNYNVIESIDDVITGSGNGWAINANPPANAVYSLGATPVTVDSVTILSGVNRGDHHLDDFALSWTAESNPTLSSTFSFITGVVIGSDVAGGVWANDRINCDGQDTITINFDSVEATGIKLTVYGSDSSNNNIVLTEFFVGGVETQVGEWTFDALPTDKTYTVKITTEYAVEGGEFPSSTVSMPGTCVLSTCPDPDLLVRQCSDPPGTANNLPTGAVTCLSLKNESPSRTTGFYLVDPDGDGTMVTAYCDMSTDGGGWTLIISQMNGLFTADIETYVDITPALDTSGALAYYLHADLTCVVGEIKAENINGQSYTFDMDEFTAWNGALRLNDDNTIMSYNTNKDIGVIAGDHYPVVHHYDVSCGYYQDSARCSSGSPCYGVAACSTSYSHGGLSVWDWNTNNCVAQVDRRAHFGGTTNIESTWATRGKYLWAR